MSNAATVVDAFIEAVERRDLDAALDLVSDDVEYENVPMAVVHGRDAVRDTLAPLVASAAEVEWRVLEQVHDADTVLNERIDRFRVDGRWIEVRVAGVFKIRDGRITRWCDYFDLQQFSSQLGGS